MEGIVMKLYYEFDSDYVEDKYYVYDGREFEYEIDDQDAKDFIAECYKNELDETWSGFNTILSLLDQLDYEDWLNWGDLFEHFRDELTDKYIGDAMQWYADEHYIMTKQDYEDIQADYAYEESKLKEFED
jgi:hypothetical protein